MPTKCEVRQAGWHPALLTAVRHQEVLRAPNGAHDRRQFFATSSLACSLLLALGTCHMRDLSYFDVCVRFTSSCPPACTGSTNLVADYSILSGRLRGSTADLLHS